MRKHRVFATGSVWSILIYLLYSSMEDIKRTHYFFIDTSIHPSVRKKFKCHTFNTAWFDCHWWRIHQAFSILEPLLYRLRWPYLMYSDFFGIDQGSAIHGIFGRNEYTLIEDGANDYIVSREPVVRRHERLKQLIFGPINGHDFCNNPLCKKIILTREPTNDYLRQRAEQVNLKELWKNAEQEKKEYILNAFSVTMQDLDKMKMCKVLLLTQPFSEDKACTEEEKIQLYRDIISSHGESNVIIKTHPREKTNYRAVFPQAIVFDKIVPMQLFGIIGITFKHVATICSTAALAFLDDKSTTIDFKGTTKYPNIHKVYGKVELEDILKKQ